MRRLVIDDEAGTQLEVQYNDQVSDLEGLTFAEAWIDLVEGDDRLTIALGLQDIDDLVDELLAIKRKIVEFNKKHNI